LDRFETSAELALALGRLCETEPRFAPLLAAYGVPSLRRVAPTLESLLSIVTDQFLSLSAGAAIWARVRERLGEVTPEAVTACPPEDLVTLGLSRAKAKCFHAAAASAIDFASCHLMDARDFRSQLLKVWGIGPWTADVFMLSAMGHADAWPAGDIALQHAIRDFLSLAERPGVKEMETHARPWRPYRAAAARLLWSHYRHVKGLAQAPSQN
jgi:DNA-3-methyladenine glycosylase II